MTVIDRVVNSFLLHDGTEDEEEKNSAEARTSVAGVRKGKRRFSVLGMRFGGKDDENKKEHHVGSGTVMSQQFGFIGPQDNVMSGAMISGVGQKDGPAGTANVVRIGGKCFRVLFLTCHLLLAKSSRNNNNRKQLKNVLH